MLEDVTCLSALFVHDGANGCFKGKFGMYGAPSSIKVKALEDDASLYQLSFTTLTPGMRESDRKYFVSVRSVTHTLVLLLVGTTANRFAGQENVMRKVAQSWQVVEAPKKSTSQGHTCEKQN